MTRPLRPRPTTDESRSIQSPNATATRRKRRPAVAFAASVMVLAALVNGGPGEQPAAEAADPILCDGQPATKVGTIGPDTIDGTAGNDVISGLGGNDVVNGLGGDDLICGGPGQDTLRGGIGADTLRGGTGNDTLRGGNGADEVAGSDGADKLYGGQGNDTLYGRKGSDWLDGGNGADHLAGYAGPDSLYGRAGNDALFGGLGNDMLSGGLGTETCTGGNGSDFADTSCESLVSAELFIPGPDYPVGPTNWSILVDQPDYTEFDDGETHVIENVRYLEGIRVEGSGTHVTLRNCVVVNPGSFWTVFVTDGASLVMEDCQIGQATDEAGERGVGGDNVTLRRVKILGHVDGIKAGDDSLYEQVWILDLRDVNDQGHEDGIQADGGSSGWTVRYSRIEPDGPPDIHANAAIFIKSDLGPISDVLIEHTIVDDGNYTIYSDKGGSHPYPTDVVIRNTGFGHDYLYGILSDPGGLVTWEGNYWVDTGQCIGKTGNVIPGTCS
jgi:RTX calcium-binding nonapeptide repeat (4 copies)